VRLTATQGAQKALNQIRDDIRQGKSLQVGTADNSGNFTALIGTNAEVGNALQIFATTNQTAPYSIYFLQTNTIGATAGAGGISSNLLLWISVPTNGVTNVLKLACYITNLHIFTAEDWQDSWPGTTVTNPFVNNVVYSVKLQFYQWAYPIALPITNATDPYVYYQLRTRVCRHAIQTQPGSSGPSRPNAEWPFVSGRSAGHCASPTPRRLLRDSQPPSLPCGPGPGRLCPAHHDRVPGRRLAHFHRHLRVDLEQRPGDPAEQPV
jgi:hypothetical protein